VVLKFLKIYITAIVGQVSVRGTEGNLKKYGCILKTDLRAKKYWRRLKKKDENPSFLNQKYGVVRLGQEV